MKHAIMLSAATCLVSITVRAGAVQGGSGHYMSGQTTDLSGLAPTQPGWIVGNYLVDYHEGTFGSSRGLPFGRTVALGVTADVTAEVPLVIFAYPFRFLGGTLSSGVAVPVVWPRVEATATIDHRNIRRSIQVQDATDGLGDIEVMPAMAAWKHGDFQFDVMFNFWAPTGEYDRTRLANAGLGYWTFEPMVAFSWVSSKIGLETTAFAAIDFNTENQAASYHSGAIFHLDATLAEHLPLFGGIIGLGASGFYLQQVSGDSGAGARLGGFEAQSLGVGPTISYIHKIRRSTLVVDASWLPQLHTENTTKGSYFWLRLGFAI